MNNQQFKVIDIDALVLGTRYQHAVLIYKPLEHLLSYPAVWLSEQNSYKTSLEYAKVLQRFCNYLTALPFFNEEDNLLSFWNYTNVEVIKAWKTYRVQNKYDQNKISPAFETIDREAKIVCKFLDWVKFDKNVNTLWNGKRKTILKARSIHHDILRGIAGPRQKEVVDVNLNISFSPNRNYPIEGLAKRRQSKPHEYLSDEQMGVLINSFPDIVYKFISLTAYITGLRDFEILAIPYWVVYDNGSIFSSDPSYLQKRLNERFIRLKVLGKGNKLREINVDIASWYKIMQSWAPFFQERKRLYESKTGQNLPLNILWLDKSGDPIYCPPGEYMKHKNPTHKLQDAFYYVSKKRKNDPLSIRFGRNVDYYSLRHTYATNYVLRVMEARRERDRDKYIEDHSLRHDLANKMGHNSLDTTFAKYVDNAIVLIKDREAGKGRHVFPNLNELLEHQLLSKK